MTPFHVGMRVVCVDDEWPTQTSGDPVAGCVYEIEGVQKDSRPPSGLSLDLIGFADFTYCSSAFRPAHENRMDELRTLLAPVPSKERELVQS